jgi:DNA-binding NarL/FixJ family response regulator
MKVLIIENHPLIVDGLKKALHLYFEGVNSYEATNAEQGDELLYSQPYDLVICDYFLGNKNGLDLYQHHRKRKHFRYFILVSILQNAAVIEKALNQGVNGFLSKECDTNELVKGIKEVLSGKTFICTYTTNLIQEHQKKTNPFFITKREMEIIRLLVLDYKNQEIAEHLHVAVSTIESHKKNLVKKFNVGGAAGLVRFVLENNILEQEN